jgi:putative SOS response-associated peptidase YedK
MCGRFTLRIAVEKLAPVFEFDADDAPQLPPRFNIAPAQPVATVAVVTGDRRCRLMRWGLIPPWAKDPAVGSRLINARAESLAEKPSFRSAFARRRCLILANGFHEWPRGAGLF